ncbi:hypothetical protein FUA26_05905 [Seonamhaeicola algicola]|uniref:Lipoprotein n=1 Tax=Seonamhaeicola algicola TaxID=1719036 RepID=A0A5C7ASE2_9FLAO|nr:hypothetical protein [Seonamhaeicola algicola]TXE11600.1 hypothetical protein FUA26_05905 [Seonamhaeicola algicola]
MKIKNLNTLALNIIFIVLITACKQNTHTTNTSFDTPNTSTNSASETYTSKMTKADKKKYYNTSGNVVFEIKYKSDGFKLRTANSDLLWKIKLYENKMKISDNEENLNPFEIKFTNTQTAKLVKNDVTLARTSYNSDKNEQIISAENASPEFYNQKYTPSLLVLKIPEMQDNEKQILIKELALKGY